MGNLKKHKFGIIMTTLVIGLFGWLLFSGGEKTSSFVGSVFTEVNLESPLSIGEEAAPVSIVQYSDFLCPSCSYFSTQIMPGVHQNYIAKGTVKFEFRPMAFIAPGSTQAGMGAYCASDQAMFWAYHDAVYNYVANSVFNQGLDPTQDTILTSEIVKGAAAAAGLDVEEFDTCLDSGEHLSSIQQSTSDANSNGVVSTPYIMVNGNKYTGNLTPEAFEALIKASM